MLRFIPGIVLLQLASVALVFAFIEAPGDVSLWLALVLVGVVLTVAVGFWFSSIAASQHRDTLSKVEQSHAEERERIRLNAERQKAKLLRANHQEILRESRRANTRANLKVSLGFAAAASVGVLMMFTQFMTLGLLLMGTSGGALAGYLARARQEANRLTARNGATGVIELNPAPEKKMPGSKKASA